MLELSQNITVIICKEATDVFDTPKFLKKLSKIIYSDMKRENLPRLFLFHIIDYTSYVPFCLFLEMCDTLSVRAVPLVYLHSNDVIEDEFTNILENSHVPLKYYEKEAVDEILDTLNGCEHLICICPPHYTNCSDGLIQNSLFFANSLGKRITCIDPHTGQTVSINKD